MKHVITLLLSLSMSAAATAATEISDSAAVPDAPKFKITPAGRVLLDGAVIMPEGEGLTSGFTAPDVRAGAKMSYGRWASTVEVGFTYGKIGMKDVFIQYKWDDRNLIKVGHMIHKFGLTTSTSSSMKPSMEEPTTASFFDLGYHPGIMFVHSGPQFYGTLSAVMAEASWTGPANDQGRSSYGGVTRLVYRPLRSSRLILHAGISGWLQSAWHKSLQDDDGNETVSPGYFDFKASFPTRVSRTTMLQANITDARHVMKLSPELLIGRGRLALESQYFYMNVARRHGLPSYSASGAYAMLRGIVLGGDYSYDLNACGLATPRPRTLEVVAAYNYTDASCRRSNINGGITNDASVTFNYYINKYMLARLRYSYTDVRCSDLHPRRHANILQARLQVIF